MNDLDLTLAIAEELHRLFPDEYGLPCIHYDNGNNPIDVRMQQLQYFPSQISMMIYKPFTLDDATCWQLWMRFKRHILEHMLTGRFDEWAHVGWIEKLTKQSFAEMLLETLKQIP